jgi:septum site-determining protein MinC
MEALSKSAAAERMRAATRSQAAFELKGVVSPLTVLRIRTRDLNLIERQLRAKLLQMPNFFHDAPVVLDLGGLDDGLRDLALPALVHVLRSMGVAPVAAAGVAEDDRALVSAAGLGVIKTGPGRDRDLSAEEPTPAPAAAAEPEPAPATTPPPRRPEAHSPPMVVREAVRAGQEIYARHTDLIVLAPVNAGAQIYADGHIHVYSSLRGRAMAGAQGLTEARIFAHKLEAELVAIAGAYVMADDIPAERRGRPSQVFLERGECRISAL